MISISPLWKSLKIACKIFQEAIVLISHDHLHVLINFPPVILGLGTQSDTQLFADYRQWEQFQADKARLEKEQAKPKAEKKEAPARGEERPKKMNFSEKREWEQMEGKILALENEIEHLHSVVQDPALLAQTDKLQQACESLGEKQHALEKLYQRWQELEMKNN